MITNFNTHKSNALIGKYRLLEKAIRGIYINNYHMLTGDSYRASLASSYKLRYTKETLAEKDAMQFIDLLKDAGTVFVELLNALRVYDNPTDLTISAIPVEMFKMRHTDAYTGISVLYGRSGAINNKPLNINILSAKVKDEPKLYGEFNPISIEYVGGEWNKDCPHATIVTKLLTVFHEQSLSVGNGYGVKEGESLTTLEYAFVIDETQYTVLINLDNNYYHITR